MKKILFLSLVTLSSLFSVFADENTTESLKVAPYIRLRSISNFITRQSTIDFDTSGIVFTKKFGENLSAVIDPQFLRTSSLNPLTSTTATNYTNDTLTVFINEAYAKVNDLTRTYGDCGLSLTAGQYASPFYGLEQYYQPFRFISKPLEDRELPNGKIDLGLMLSKKFLNDAVNVSLSYITGTSRNSQLFASVNNDNVNAGGSRLLISLFPFKKYGDAVKDLSFTFNLKALGRTNARSYYNFLIGYKYGRFATSMEYLQTYSTDRSKFINATSFGASYDVWGPFQALVRWDYQYVANAKSVRIPDHFLVMGVNMKWFEGKLQTALTYDTDRNPSTRATLSNRFMIAMQYVY